MSLLCFGNGKMSEFQEHIPETCQKLCFRAFANVQFKEPIRIFDQNFQVKMTVI